MNKILIVGVVAIVILGVGGYLALTSGNNSTTVENTSNSNFTSENIASNNASNNEKFNGTFIDLLKLGKDYTCKINTKDDLGNATNGTVYVSANGDKLNGNFSITQADGNTMTSNIIRDGKFNYIWSSLASQGYKTPITNADNSIFGDSSNSESNTGLNDNDKVDFNCKQWKVDNSKFVPPTDINFIDISEQTQQLQDKTNSLKGVDCSVCDNLPSGDSKDQCLSALGC